MGSEKPGSVVKGPPITVTCDCGERTELFYGERWTCPSCGRTYDTRQVESSLKYVAHRKGRPLKHRARHVAAAVAGSQAVKGAARRGDPFRRHRT